MNAELKHLLRSMPVDSLADLIESIHGRHADIDHRIESQLLRSDPTALARSLKKRIQSIKRGRRFIPYRESHGFSLTLEAIITDIEPLLEQAPRAAFELADLFCATHPNSYDRADDSSGSIGDAYHEAVQLWLRAATLWRRTNSCKTDWPQEIYARFQANDYAIWDNLIPNSATLLSKEELTQLAWRFEGDIKGAAGKDDNNDPYNHAEFQATLGLTAVAEALGDVRLYERATLLHSPQPNEQQKRSIIEFCLSIDDGQSALKWLQEPWSAHFASDHGRLLDKTLSLLGQTDELISLRRSAYDADPDFDRLQALLDVLPEHEKDAVRDGAIDRALAAGSLYSAIATLIALDAQDLAARTALERADSLDSVGYNTLARWAQTFSHNGHALAAAICYRTLLEDILDSGRSNAYGHAARYYKNLAQLDTDIANYHPFSDRAGFETALRERHGRKSSFWRQAE
uniref:DUF6880 family protein n=1 Tax=Marinobacterium profundum TaxID=1714300 RepID=UPI000AE8CFA1|nr:DUF6880 family protein [Marinobacterium profundum]